MLDWLKGKNKAPAAPSERSSFDTARQQKLEDGDKVFDERYKATYSTGIIAIDPQSPDRHIHAVEQKDLFDELRTQKWTGQVYVRRIGPNKESWITDVPS